MNKNGYAGKTALVTGASSGIGREIAISLAEHGARVLLAGRRGDQLRMTGEEIERRGGSYLAMEVDIANEEQVKHLLSYAVAQMGRLDIAVNAAGILHMGAIDETGLDAFDETMAVNVVGTWLCLKHEILAMKQGSGGAIVNIASNIGPHLIRPGAGAYAASKAAVNVLTRTAALEAIGHGIRVNGISPGPFDTGMSYRAGEDTAARDARIASVNPSRRVGQLAEIASAVLWLCSDAAGYVVGHDLVIDGGASI